MNRRSFIGGILALGIAPAVVRAENIMRVRPVFDARWATLYGVDGQVLVRLRASPGGSFLLDRSVLTCVVAGVSIEELDYQFPRPAVVCCGDTLVINHTKERL